MNLKPKIFIDGQYGTTGLLIHELLSSRDDINLLNISDDDKRNTNIKQKLLNEADLVFLCLPDGSSLESVALITNDTTRIIDASSQFRCDDNWTYGFPELSIHHREAIISSSRVTVPGCHATGFIASLFPLICNGIVDISQKLICNSITGYSGGGKKMIQRYEDPDRNNNLSGTRPYSFNLEHKHIPEIMKHLGLLHSPLFTPSVGDFKRGLLVSSHFIKDDFVTPVNRDEIISLFDFHYKDKSFVKIIKNNDDNLDHGSLDLLSCNGTNRIEFSFYEDENYILINTVFDNLGKGSSGAAIQCMNLMLGFDEMTGLIN